MTPEEQFDAYDRRCQAIIHEHGWMVQGVGAGDGEPQFAYTTGLTVAGLPELVLSGLDFGVMTTLLNSAAKHSLDAELKPGDVLEGIASVVFRVIAAPYAVVSMPRHLYGPEAVTALQLVWPDRDGRYPGDPGWNWADAQVLYGKSV